MVASSAADWLSAIGTVGAVVLALVLVLQERFKRPRLVLVCGNELPWWREVQGAAGHDLRIQVVNDSRSAAQSVRLRVELFHLGERASAGEVQWMKPDLVSGAWLQWVEAGMHGGVEPIDLAPGGTRYATLLRHAGGRVDVAPPVGPRRGPAQLFRAVVVITCENAAARRHGIELEVIGEQATVTFTAGLRHDSDPLEDPNRLGRVTTRDRRP